MPDRNGSGMNLPQRVRAAKQAIFRAGFQSGKFKPHGPELRIDVLVPITFLDATFMCNEEGMREHVWDAVRGTCLMNRDRANDVRPDPNFECPGHPPVADVPRPADLRTKEGRVWRAAQKQAVTA